jgi:hypothetical protein
MKKGFSSASSSLPLVTRMFLLGLDQAHAFAQHDGVVGGIELIPHGRSRRTRPEREGASAWVDYIDTTGQIKQS